MDFDVVNGLVAKLGTMRYFPCDPAVRLALVESMGTLTDDEDQVRWLVQEIRTRYREWPGEFEVRQVFTSRYRPKDGVIHSVCSCGCGRIDAFTLKPDQTWPPQLEAPCPLLLPAGAVKQCKEELDAAVAILSAAMTLKNRAITGPATEAEIRSAPEWLRRLEGFCK